MDNMIYILFISISIPLLLMALLMEKKALFHGVYDQASLVVNPEKPNCTDKRYLGKDYVHPNLEGGKIVADNIDLDLFR